MRRCYAAATYVPSPSHPAQVIAPRGARKVYVTSTAPMHEHTSLMACGSSGGRWINPLLLFQGQRPLTKLFEGFPEAHVAMTESGYMDGPTFAGWAEVFIKESGASSSRPILLLVDQHSSHLGPRGSCTGQGCSQASSEDGKASALPSTPAIAKAVWEERA